MTTRDPSPQFKHGECDLFTVTLKSFVYFWNLGMFNGCEALQLPFSALPSGQQMLPGVGGRL